MECVWLNSVLLHCLDCPVIFGLSRWYIGKEFTCNAENTESMSLVPGSGKSPGEGKGTPTPGILAWKYGRLQYEVPRVGHHLTPKQQLNGDILGGSEICKFCQNSKLPLLMAQNHQF